ncbi:PilZ domain-containing protein [Rhizobium sp. LEGMi135b]
MTPEAPRRHGGTDAPGCARPRPVGILPTPFVTSNKWKALNSPLPVNIFDIRTCHISKNRNQGANAMTAFSPEGRVATRKRTLLGAKIIFNDGHSVFDCLVRNLSDTGAMIQIENPLAAPNAFNLQLSDERLLPCTVRWRKINSMGVEFV